jgi:membrane dipeptidase
MIVPGWVRGQSRPEAAGVTLAKVVDHIDHICQVAGNARHVGIGSDLDGAFGREQTATDLSTIADLTTILGLLGDRGYAEADVVGIAHRNFVDFLRRAWS